MKLWLKSLFWPLKQIDAALPKSGLILDLGCGEGIIAKYLAQNLHRQVIGLDTDRDKLALAVKRTRHLPNLSFKFRNILQANLNQISGCVISDVLHHLSPSQQHQFLRRLGSQLKPGATCVIKEANKNDLFLSSLTRFWDWLLYPNDKINYYSAKQLMRLMNKLGFSVIFKPLRYPFPGSVNLFICTKQY